MSPRTTSKPRTGRLGVHGTVRTRLHDATTGLLVAEHVDENIETQTALNSIASWIVGGANVVTPPTASYIALGSGYPNLLTAGQASFETGLTGWAASSNCTIAQSSTVAWDGVYSMAMTASSAASMSASTTTGTGGIPVTGGNRYAASAHFQPATTARQVQVSIGWYDTNGNLLSTSVGDAITTETASVWTRAYVEDTAPATAAYAAVVVTVVSAGNGEVHYVDGVQLEAAWDGPSAWAAGGQTGTPAITDTVMFAERYATRKQIDSGFTQQSLAALLHTYQTTDPSGTFTEAGLWTGAPAAAALSLESAAGATSLPLAGGAPAVVAGQRIWLATGIPLGLGLTDNLLTAAQASFESATFGWTAVANCTIAQSAAKAYIGANSLAITATGAGQASATTPTGTGAFLITPGLVYAFSGWFLAAATPETCGLQIVWYDNTGTQVATSVGATVTDSTSVWTRAEAVATPPTTALATTLASGMTNAQTTMNVGSTAGFPSTGTLKITTGTAVEVVTYTGLTPGSFTGLTRGARSTTAIAHNSGDSVSFYLGATYAAVQPLVTMAGASEVHYFDAVFFSATAGEYATVAAAAAAGASSWTLTDPLLMTHPAAAVVTVFNGSLWAHALLANAAKTNTQLLSVQWEVELTST